MIRQEAGVEREGFIEAHPLFKGGSVLGYLFFYCSSAGLLKITEREIQK
jgi:hypothetical protein